MRRSTAAVLTAMALSLSGVAPARAAAGSKMPVTEWYTSGYSSNAGYTNLKTTEYFGTIPTPRAEQDTPGHNFINQFWTQRGNAGYVTLQVVPGELLHLFSWWDAIDVYCSGVPNLKLCGSFSNEGSGRQVLMRYDFLAHRDYEHQVAYGWQDAVGIWWNSYIKDTQTGVVTFTGSIKTPLAWGHLQGTVTQMIEHLGWARADTCDEIAQASLWRSNPTWNGTVRAATRYSKLGHPSNPCPAAVFDHNGGVVQELGTP